MCGSVALLKKILKMPSLVGHLSVVYPLCLGYLRTAGVPGVLRFARSALGRPLKVFVPDGSLPVVSLLPGHS